MGGDDAPLSPDEGARVPVHMATLESGGPNGKFYGEVEGDIKEIPW